MAEKGDGTAEETDEIKNNLGVVGIAGDWMGEPGR